MAVEIRSPYSGRRVQVRQQDLNRAVRDEQGRVFYLVQRTDGQGYYASPTRHGSQQDEQNYLQLEQRIAEQGEPPPPQGQDAQRVHDATGPGRPLNSMRLIAVVSILAILVLAGIILAFWLIGVFDVDPPAPPDPTNDQTSAFHTDLWQEQRVTCTPLDTAIPLVGTPPAGLDFQLALACTPAPAHLPTRSPTLALTPPRAPTPL